MYDLTQLLEFLCNPRGGRSFRDLSLFGGLFEFKESSDNLVWRSLFKLDFFFGLCNVDEREISFFQFQGLGIKAKKYQQFQSLKLQILKQKI